MIDIAKLTSSDVAFLEGFVAKCAAAGVDPEALLVKVSQDGEEQAPDSEKSEPAEKEDGDTKKTVKRVAGGAGRGAVAGGAIGAGLGALGTGVALAKPVMKGMQSPSSNKGHLIRQALKMMMAGGAAGGIGGAATGAVTGGAVQAAV